VADVGFVVGTIIMDDPDPACAVCKRPVSEGGGSCSVTSVPHSRILKPLCAQCDGMIILQALWQSTRIS
jgi:hypothetical protein